MDAGIGQPWLSIFRANGEEYNCRLAGIIVNAARRMFAADFFKRRVATHIAKGVGKFGNRQR
jgi:phosphoribosylformylglycinamidine (FGAM) synthase-like amidotransferase family enzyme